jgi:hypothetical protein
MTCDSRTTDSEELAWCNPSKASCFALVAAEHGQLCFGEAYNVPCICVQYMQCCEFCLQSQKLRLSTSCCLLLCLHRANSTMCKQHNVQTHHSAAACCC